jgi:hypothetical protein
MTYADLQTTVLDWLMRPDLAAVVPDFIANAEARLNRDARLRNVSARTDFVVDQDGVTLPSDLRAIDAWYLDGPTFFGPIYVVRGEELARTKLIRTTPGAPYQAAIMGRTAYFAPVPDAEYTTRLSYTRRVPALSDAEPTNWLLEDHPDIYRLAVLAESAPYLKEDERVMLWEGLLEKRLEDLHLTSVQEQFSGTLAQTFRPIGG